MTSLSTVEQADAYFAGLLHSSDWSGTDKLQALVSATQILNTFAYMGVKLVDTQENEWPRKGIMIGCIEISGTPDAILFAQYEIARALKKGIDPEREIRNLRVTSRGYSSVRTTYDPRYCPEHLKYGVPSALAWSYLSTYLVRDQLGTVRLHRVS